jgi:hypothetical protein
MNPCLTLQVSDFVDRFKHKSNETAHLAELLAPFGIKVTIEESEDLTTGLVLEEILSEFRPGARIEWIDIIESFLKLGDPVAELWVSRFE